MASFVFLYIITFLLFPPSLAACLGSGGIPCQNEKPSSIVIFPAQMGQRETATKSRSREKDERARSICRYFVLKWQREGAEQGTEGSLAVQRRCEQHQNLRFVPS